MKTCIFFQFVPLYYLVSIIPTTKNAGLFVVTLHNNQDYKKVYTNYLRTNMIRNSEAMYTQVIMKKMEKNE